MRWSRESFSLQSSSSAVKRSHVPSSFWSSFCYCLRVSMTPAVQAFCHSIVSKNGHGIFNVRNDAGACCALEVETGIKECTSVGGTGEKHTHAHTHTRTHARTHTHQTKPKTKTPPPHTHTHNLKQQQQNQPFTLMRPRVEPWLSGHFMQNDRTVHQWNLAANSLGRLIFPLLSA